MLPKVPKYNHFEQKLCYEYRTFVYCKNILMSMHILYILNSKIADTQSQLSKALVLRAVKKEVTEKSSVVKKYFYHFQPIIMHNIQYQALIQ